MVNKSETEPEHLLTNIVGVDCASDPKNVGLATGRCRNGVGVIERVEIGSAKQAPVDTVADWLRERSGPVLLAMDAPLGWPEPLARVLHTHAAGDAIDVEANVLFRRETDRFIHRKIGKQSLDVGADRIARTAFAALELIAGLRNRLNRQITTAWEPEFSDTRAIEVYPAATLIAHGISPTGYKSKNGELERRRILNSLSQLIRIDDEIPQISNASDGLDAAICVLAACDFLSGQAFYPEKDWPVKKEGWVWVRDPDA